MKIHDYETHQTELSAVERCSLVTWKTTKGTYIAQLSTIAGHINCEADTRGQAIHELGDALRQLGSELVMKAFELEGFTGLTVGDLSP